MTEELFGNLEDIAKSVIADIAKSVPADSNIRVDHREDGQITFYVQLNIEGHGRVSLFFNPLGIVIRWLEGQIKFINNDTEIANLIKANDPKIIETISTTMYEPLRFLLHELASDTSYFIYAITQKAFESTAYKVIKKEIRDMNTQLHQQPNVIGDTYRNFENQATKSLYARLDGFEREHLRNITGDSSRDLNKQDLLELKREYDEAYQNLKTIKKIQSKEKQKYKKSKGCKRHGFQIHRWTTTWLKISMGIDTHNIPLLLVQKLAYENPSTVAKEYIAERFGVRVSSIKSKFLPMANKIAATKSK